VILPACLLWSGPGAWRFGAKAHPCGFCRVFQNVEQRAARVCPQLEEVCGRSRSGSASLPQAPRGLSSPKSVRRCRRAGAIRRCVAESALFNGLAWPLLSAVSARSRSGSRASTRPCWAPAAPLPIGAVPPAVACLGAAPVASPGWAAAARLRARLPARVSVRWRTAIPAARGRLRPRGAPGGMLGLLLCGQSPWPGGLFLRLICAFLPGPNRSCQARFELGRSPHAGPPP